MPYQVLSSSPQRRRRGRAAPVCDVHTVTLDLDLGYVLVNRPLPRVPKSPRVPRRGEAVPGPRRAEPAPLYRRGGVPSGFEC